ncbi:MAG: hypothetical protein GY711_27895 [bacterium]|nr:hypothetical protein [bacterium]
MENKANIFTVLAVAAACEAGTGALTTSAWGQQLLFDQPLIVSHPAAGFGERHNCFMGHQANSFRQDDSVMEDVTISDVPNGSGWLVKRVRVFAFACDDGQTSPPASTITRMGVRFWNDVPYSPGAEVVAGDLGEDVLEDTGWTGFFRVPGPGTQQLTNWPIMYADAEVEVYLEENATYWVEWGLDSSGVGEACANQPAVPANYGVPGNALVRMSGTSPRPTDPRAFGCAGNAQASFDELPLQLIGDPVGDPSFPDLACMALSNSTGVPAELHLLGTGVAGDSLYASVAQGPPANFGYFLSGPNAGLYIVPPGAAGLICIGGPQFRYNQAALGHVFQFDAGGTSQATAGGGPSSLPTDGSFGPVPAVMAGETRYFQAWYRDGGTSNFSDSSGVAFL